MSDQVVLLLDAGNSRLKWAVLSGGQRSAQYSVRYPEYHDSPDTFVLFHLETLFNQYQPRLLVIVHVLGDDLTASLEALCGEYACQLHLVNHQKNDYGINIAYYQPERLGTDRLVGLLAAAERVDSGSVIMIDCGTAVTVDALKGREHLGGVILPGLKLLGDSLITNTQAAHMMETVLTDPDVFAKDTTQGMGSGCLFMLVGAIEGICQRMQDEMGTDVVRVICGGDAEWVHKHLMGDYLLVPDALMDGLQCIAERI